MPLEPHQKSVLLIMRARLLGNLALASFAFGLVPILGWGRVMEHQILLGFCGAVVLFFASDRILRYLPEPDVDGTGPKKPDRS
ncbi:MULTISPECIES: hypothetical protein [unclassified Brevundimonas]|jgi:hypothetical protein|uniref:hypothetical protein n=1 Tax=unclassified Brevundimonas TaxID=2622653 RepID=UPI0025B7FE6B|nr:MULTISPECIES: hypothetical protein [unclassified Brevundimonas]